MTIVPTQNPADTRGQAPTRAVRVVAVTSGKGGVGKSNLVVNLAVQFAASGRRVLVLDADLGLANCDLLMGVAAKRDLRHVLHHGATLDECITEGPGGVHLLSGGNGVVELTELGSAERVRLLDVLEPTAARYDTLLVDTGAGIGGNVRFFAGAAHEVMLVITPEPTSLADAYSTVKVLSGVCGVRRVLVCVNRAPDLTGAREAFSRIHTLVSRFLPVVLEFGGWIPSDTAVEDAVRSQVPFCMLHPMSPAAQRTRALAEAIVRRRPDAPGSGGLQLFWRNLILGSMGGMAAMEVAS